MAHGPIDFFAFVAGLVYHGEAQKVKAALEGQASPYGNRSNRGYVPIAIWRSRLRANLLTDH